MNWNTLSEVSLLDTLQNNSTADAASSFAIFKHSTRCNTSSMAKKLFEQDWKGDIPVYLLLVVEDRKASNAVSEIYKVSHESPQVLLIKNGVCIHHASHSMIDAIEVASISSSEKS